MKNVGKKNLPLFISFDKSIKLLMPIKLKAVWDEGQVLEKIFKDFLLENNITLNKNYYLYLKRKDKVLTKLSKTKKIYELELKFNDEIVVSFRELKVPKNSENETLTKKNLVIKEENLNQKVYNNENEKDIPENKNKINEILIKYNKSNRITNSLKSNGNSERKKWTLKDNEIIYHSIKNGNDQTNFQPLKKKNIFENKVFLISLIIIKILVLIGIAIFFIIKKFRKKKENLIEYKKEDLIIKKSYPLNLLLRFTSNKKTEIDIIGENDTQNIISEINDFIFIVREREIEKDEKTLIEKEYFKGYICILNHTMINDTDVHMTIYDKQLNKYLNDNLTNVITPNLKYIGENGNICFIKK